LLPAEEQEEALFPRIGGLVVVVVRGLVVVVVEVQAIIGQVVQRVR
jgi:hypothetical protein